MTFKYTNTTSTSEYFVFHSEVDDEGLCSHVVISEIEPESSVASGQPYAEKFDSKEEAEEYAVSLGYEIPDVEELPS
jgi:hypothetical protein